MHTGRRNGKDGAGESEVKRVIDYIFYASGEGSGSLRPVSRWAEPSLVRPNVQCRSLLLEIGSGGRSALMQHRGRGR